MAAALLAEHTPADRVKLAGDTLTVGSHVLPLLAEPTPGGQTSRQALLDFRATTHASDGSASVYPVYSFFDVLLSDDRLSSGQTPPIDPSVFKDKIVFVGTTAAGLSDVYTTPLGGAPGMLLHATLADNIIDGPVMRRATPRVDVALTIGVALAVALIATLVPVAWGVALALLFTGAFVAFLTEKIGEGLWIGAVPPLAAAAVALFGGVAWQYVVEGRAKRHVKQLFGRYVAKDVIDQLMADPALVRLGGARREMTVLFSDIRGFTTASEQGTPEAVVAQLNEYFGVMVDVLFRHQGTLDKFVGDMVMGLFGAPLEDPLHADHAVATALEMIAELDKLNVKWRAAGTPTVDIGIGINTGEMIAGNIGSSAIMSYTVIGDAVNLGSRLESLNKEHGTRILISQGTLDRLTRPVETRRIGDVTVKGRKAPVTVYEVIAPRGH
jgi:adenylate cyclase